MGVCYTPCGSVRQIGAPIRARPNRTAPESLVGRVMRAVQHVLVCYASCVRLAPPPHTRMPLVGPTSAPARMGRCGSPRCSEEGPAKAVPAAVAAAAATTGSEPEVLFPRLTDDGYSFYDDRYVSSGGSEAWLQNLKGTLSSQVLQRVGAHLAVTTGIAVAVALAFGCAREGLLPEELARLVEGAAIPLFPHSAAGSVLGLLLAFRTSQSYERFWEARLRGRVEVRVRDSASGRRAR